MTITRVGSNTKYASGWESAFGKSKRKTKSAKSAAAKTVAAKKTAKRSGTKKKAKR